jgi:hypothetical protein
MAPTAGATTKASALAAAPAAGTPGGGASKVRANGETKVYHCMGDRYYGKTKKGEYLSEADAQAKRAHAPGGLPKGRRLERPGRPLLRYSLTLLGERNASISWNSDLSSAFTAWRALATDRLTTTCMAPKSYTTILHCLANEISLELLGSEP